MVKVEEIPIDEIEMGTSQTRSRKVEVGIDELSRNITKVGLLHPVLVFKTDGKYELIAGQRRLLAVTKLGWKKIPAQVIEKPDETKAKMISFSETFVRKDLVKQDVIDVVLELYHKYNTMTAVAEELGLSVPTISKYIKFERLPPQLKEMVKADKVKLDLALKATDASTMPDGNVDEDKAVQLAVQMKPLSDTQRDKQVETAAEKPESTVDELIEEANKTPVVEPLNLELLLSTAKSLKEYAKQEIKSKEEAAVELIIDGLQKAGY